MAQTADFAISSDGGSTYAGTNAPISGSAALVYNVAGSYSIKALLAGVSGLNSCAWSITGADDNHHASPPTITTSADKSYCTFTLPKQGGSWLLQAKVNGGINLQTGAVDTTLIRALKIAVLNSAGNEEMAVGETYEGNAVYGYVKVFNGAVRSGALGALAGDVTGPAGTNVVAALQSLATVTKSANDLGILCNVGTTSFGISQTITTAGAAASHSYSAQSSSHVTGSGGFLSYTTGAGASRSGDFAITCADSAGLPGRFVVTTKSAERFVVKADGNVQVGALAGVILGTAGVLSAITGTQGDILTKGASVWAGLGAGAVVNGLLTTGGAGANPAWSTVVTASALAALSTTLSGLVFPWTAATPRVGGAIGPASGVDQAGTSLRFFGGLPTGAGDGGNVEIYLSDTHLGSGSTANTYVATPVLAAVYASAGNCVGINTATPAFALDVNGRAQAGNIQSTGNVKSASGYRALLSAFQLSTTSINYASDADKTLTSSEYDGFVLKLASGVNMTGAKKLILPLTLGAMWIVYNGTSTATGATINVIGASGTGVTIANNAASLIYCADGANLIKLVLV